MAQHRRLPEREHRRQASPVGRDLRMTDGIDAGEHAMECARLRTLLDSARRQATRGELAEAQDAVLLGGDASDDAVRAPWAR
jgi:hypothetical protein